MSKIKNLISDYQPIDEQEEKDKQLLLLACETFEDVLTRANEFMHFTASCFVINAEHTKVLCAYHNIYDTWGWCGGHADGDDDLLAVALRECNEETGAENLKVLNNNNPISIENLPVESHYKNGKYVASHLHMNVTYLFEADEKQPLRIAPDENSAVQWMTFEELLCCAREPVMKRIYRKIINQIIK